MRHEQLLFIVGLSFVLTGCFETLPTAQEFSKLMPLLKAPSLKDKNAAIARAWDDASLACRAEHKPIGSYCEQLKVEGGFLGCAASKFSEAAKSLSYPAPDQIWVWRNCVMQTSGLLRDGVYMSRPDIERRVAACQAKLDPEPEYPVRQSGWLGAFADYLTPGEKEPLRAVVPSDFGIHQSRVALVSCDSRFPVQNSAERQMNSSATLPVAERPPVPVGSTQLATETTTQPPADPEVSKDIQKQAANRKPTGNGPALRNPTDLKRRSVEDRGEGKATPSKTETNALKSCPIPGACGPSVPVGAVNR